MELKLQLFTIISDSFVLSHWWSLKNILLIVCIIKFRKTYSTVIDNGVDMLMMEGSCSCKHPAGEYINLTEIASTDGYPKFMDIGFPQTKMKFLYFYNPCIPYNWPHDIAPKDAVDTVSDKNITVKSKPDHTFNSTTRTTHSSKVSNYRLNTRTTNHAEENNKAFAKNITRIVKRRLPRGNFSKQWGNRCENAAFCQYNRDYDYQVVATQDVGNGQLYCQLNKTINKMQLIYRGKKHGRFYQGGLSVTLECDPERTNPILIPQYDAENNLESSEASDPSTWKYVILKHKCCCPGECVTSTPIIYYKGNPQKINKTVFFVTIAVVGICLFAVLFLLYNHQQSKVQYQRPRRRNNIFGPLSDYFISYNDIQIKETIGEGGYGVVYNGTWRNSEVAVKHLRENLTDEPDIEAFKREAAVLCSLRHHNIVQFMGVCLVHPHYCIVTEFMEGGSVATILHIKKQVLSWKTRLKWAADAAKGMAFLHAAQPPIMHRDLKSDNLLVDENGLVKVADFGTVKIIESVFGESLERRRRAAHNAAHRGSGFHTQFVGTVRWAAPEVIPRKYQTGPVEYSPAADVYSYGTVVFEIISNKRPYEDLGWDHEVMDAIHAGVRPQIPNSCVPEVGRFIKSCWEHNRRMRPNFEQILALLFELQAIIPSNR